MVDASKRKLSKRAAIILPLALLAVIAVQEKIAGSRSNDYLARPGLDRAGQIVGRAELCGVLDQRHSEAMDSVARYTNETPYREVGALQYEAFRRSYKFELQQKIDYNCDAYLRPDLMVYAEIQNARNLKR